MAWLGDFLHRYPDLTLYLALGLGYPTVQARQAIGVFDSGSGGMVAAAYLTRMLRDAGQDVSVLFFGDTANLPYGKKTQEHVARLSGAIIHQHAPFCPVIGIACNTASASWARLGHAGKRPGEPRVFSVVQVAAELAYEKARTVVDPQMGPDAPALPGTRRHGERGLGLRGLGRQAQGIRPLIPRRLAHFPLSLPRRCGMHLPSIGPAGRSSGGSGTSRSSAHKPHRPVRRGACVRSS